MKKLREKLREKLRKKRHHKATTPENVHVPTTLPIFDSRLEDDIKDILSQCVTKTATISVRRQTGKNPSEHQVLTIAANESLGRQRTTTDGDYVYHIASISKILIATAVWIAFEKSPSENSLERSRSEDSLERSRREDGLEILLQRFRDNQHVTLTRLFNEYSAPEEIIFALPGKPTIYDLLVHSNGVISSTHRLLTPTGDPIMALTDLWHEVISRISSNTPEEDNAEPSAGYSNINYGLVAMAVEKIWGGSIESFLEKILFLPLGMHRTSLGVPTDERTDNKGRVVDARGIPHDIQRPQYRPDGAEAAAFGVYSTANDLDIFFKFIIDTFHGEEILPGFKLPALNKALKFKDESLLFTPFGLSTQSGSSDIGALSPNRALFPEEDFSNYIVMPDQGEEKFPVFYMAGSAIASGCATALYLAEEYSFAVTVLTDTSGPVDAADHTLRLVLQRMAQWMGRSNSSSTSRTPVNVREMVEKNKVQALKKWQELEQKQVQDLAKARLNTRFIEGVYEGVDFKQRLVISREVDGKTYVTVDGPLRLRSSVQLEIYWIDDSNLKIIIPLHLSVDWLDGADWSNTVFHVEGSEQVVQALVRTTACGEDKYLRKPSNS